MSNLSKLYEGNNSYGVSIQVALRIDGVWFWREYAFNGYGMGWTKWREYVDAYTKDRKAPTFAAYYGDTLGAREFADEYGQELKLNPIPEGERYKIIQWGYNQFPMVEGELPRYRLP